MKLFIATLLMFAFTVQAAKAECDFSTGIKPLPDGNYEYTKECNIKVGIIKRDLDADNAQLDSYQEAITLKDLAISDADKRATIWQENSLKLEDRVTAIDSLEHKNNILYFVLGIVVTSAAVYGASQLAHK